MAELRELIKEIIPTKDISLQRILNNLLDSEFNLELKTHIFKPKQLASLVVLSKYLKSIGLIESSKIIDDFIQIYLKYMISFKRLSRTEIIKAFQSINEREKLSNSQLLTANLK